MSNEINDAFAKLIDELRKLNENLLSVSVFGSYMTDEFKPWISDIDILILYPQNENKRRVRTELNIIFEKYSYLDGKMIFHSKLFDPWIYSEKEIVKLPIKRILTYSIPSIKKNIRILFGKKIVQNIPTPSQTEIIKSYLNTLVQMENWLDSHRHLLNSSRLDLVMKSVILRFFNASMGYLVVKKIVLTGHRKITKRFLLVEKKPEN